jgi:hypothetical protein
LIVWLAPLTETKLFEFPLALLKNLATSPSSPFLAIEEGWFTPCAITELINKFDILIL